MIVAYSLRLNHYANNEEWTVLVALLQRQYVYYDTYVDYVKHVLEVCANRHAYGTSSGDIGL